MLSSDFDEFILNLSVIEWSFHLTVWKKKRWKRCNEPVGTQTLSCNNRHQQCDKVWKKVTIGFGFTCDWLRDWQTQIAFWHWVNWKLLYKLFPKVSFHIFILSACISLSQMCLTKRWSNWCKHFGVNKFQAFETSFSYLVTKRYKMTILVKRHRFCLHVKFFTDGFLDFASKHF